MNDQHSQSSAATEIDVITYPDFIVEVFDEGNDLVYHFYPKDDNVFVDDFEICLEEAFQEVLPSDADVRAGFVNLMDAKNLERRSGSEAITESFWVRVKEFANRPMVELFLKEKVFEELQTRIG
tara:strand:+ start:43 stop:414 length:372 start_codon:yes stop_codon:yes gene_type:complete